MDKESIKSDAVFLAGVSRDVVFVCHHGNDSQVASKHMKQLLKGVQVLDIIGGLEAWSRQVDKNFPRY